MGSPARRPSRWVNTAELPFGAVDVAGDQRGAARARDRAAAVPEGLLPDRVVGGTFGRVHRVGRRNPDPEHRSIDVELGDLEQEWHGDWCCSQSEARRGEPSGYCECDPSGACCRVAVVRCAVVEGVRKLFSAPDFEAATHAVGGGGSTRSGDRPTPSAASRFIDATGDSNAFGEQVPRAVCDVDHASERSRSEEAGEPPR